jgi:hypothetical protein
MKIDQLPKPKTRELFDAACVIALLDAEELIKNPVAFVIYKQMVDAAEGYGDVSTHQKAARILLSNIMQIHGQQQN